jgi:hypothetical protein
MKQPTKMMKNGCNLLLSFFMLFATNKYQKKTEKQTKFIMMLSLD